MKHTTYTIIETGDGEYKLSALVNDDLTYCMPSLEVPKAIDPNNYWDNPQYLLGTLLPFLQKKKDKMKPNDDKSYKLIPKDRRKEVKGLLKQGIKLGFFKNI